MASAGGSGSSSKNQSSSTGMFSQNLAKQQLPFLQGLWKQGANLWGDNQGAIQQGQDNAQNAFGAGMQGAQQNLAGGAFNAANSGQAWGDVRNQIGGVGGTGALNQLKMADTSNPFGSGPTATQSIYSSVMGGQGNNYVDALKNSMQTDANFAQSNALNNIDQRASQAGMAGSSRAGLAQAGAIKDINTNLMRDTANLGYTSFDKDLQNKLNIASQADTNRLGAYQAGLDYNANLGQMDNSLRGQQMGYNNNLFGQLSGMLQGKQGAMDTGMNAAPTLSGIAGSGSQIPWQNLSSAADILGGPIVLGRGSTSSQSSGSAKGGGGGVSVGGG